jgi:hypothetical protein
MNTKRILIAALAGAFLSLSTQAWAGPYPGVYTGAWARGCKLAKPKVITDVVGKLSASNPDDPEAGFSTRVEGSSKLTGGEKTGFLLTVLDNGDVKAVVDFKVKLKYLDKKTGKTKSKLVTFHAEGKGPGEFTEHSFKCLTATGTLTSGKKSIPAKFTIIAQSDALGEINAGVEIIPKVAGTPLAKAAYQVEFAGNSAP